MFPDDYAGADGIVGRFRCSIAGLMAVVVLVALDCVAIRTPLRGRSLTAGMLLLGGLPMANILAAGLLPLLRIARGGVCVTPGWSVSRSSAGRPCFSIASCAYYHPDTLRESVVTALKSVRALGNPAFLAAVVTVLSLPQFGLALLGGWLNRRYGIGVTIGDRFDCDLTTSR